MSQSYEVSLPELERIASLPADDRGDRVRVTQQTSFGSDVSEGEYAQLSSPDNELAFWLSSSDHHHHHGHPHRRHGRRSAFRAGAEHDADSDSNSEGGDAAEEALAAAVVVVAAAATAAVTVGITEGARFDGWMAVPEDHPVLLIDDLGGRRWTRLEALGEGDLQRVERAVLPDLAAELYRLERHPLDRRGFVYQFELGAEPAPFGAASLGVSGRAGLGYMPGQRYGFVLGGAFSTPGSDASVGAGSPGSASHIDYRTFLQAELWPFATGRVHAGPYAEVGYAWALADTALGSQSAAGPMFAMGAALQIAWTTRLALILRAGAAWLPSIETENRLAPSGYRVSPALTFGVSVY